MDQLKIGHRFDSHSTIESEIKYAGINPVRSGNPENNNDDYNRKLEFKTMQTKKSQNYFSTHCYVHSEVDLMG